MKIKTKEIDPWQEAYDYGYCSIQCPFKKEDKEEYDGWWRGFIDAVVDKTPKKYAIDVDGVN